MTACYVFFLMNAACDSMASVSTMKTKRRQRLIKIWNELVDEQLMLANSFDKAKLTLF